MRGLIAIMVCVVACGVVRGAEETQAVSRKEYAELVMEVRAIRAEQDRLRKRIVALEIKQEDEAEPNTPAGKPTPTGKAWTIKEFMAQQKKIRSRSGTAIQNAELAVAFQKAVTERQLTGTVVVTDVGVRDTGGSKVYTMSAEYYYKGMVLDGRRARMGRVAFYLQLATGDAAVAKFRKGQKCYFSGTIDDTRIVSLQDAGRNKKRPLRITALKIRPKR